MKTLVIILLLPISGIFAAQDTTLTYESQRQKVNKLLQQRSARFGDFSESLQRRTGIFGLKTKKDMQASIDILKQIVLNDNDIFRETKTLLDFKDVQKSDVEQRASELDNRVRGYIKAISNMQKEREILKADLAAAEKRAGRHALFLFFTLLVIAALVFILLRNRRSLRR